MNILFILPVLSDSYYRKRIEKISEEGVNCTVMGFEREAHYPGKIWSHEVESLGRIQHGHYFSRIGTLLRSIYKIRRTATGKDVIYAFNLDILFISWVSTLFCSKKIKMVYDVADIRSILIRKGLLGSTLRIVEKLLLKQTSAVVVASPSYINGYFKAIQKIDHNFFVIENKVDEDLLSESSRSIQPKSEDNHLTIGYFGMIRCKESLEVLAELIEQNNEAFRLLLRGVFLQTKNFEKRFENLDNAYYNGPFVYPDDLESMYTEIDMIWAAHMHGETNTKWAISNRFFQGCYFKVPIIVQEDTQDAKLVQQYNIGLVIDLRKPSDTIDALQSIENDDINRWQKNLLQVPKDVYTFTDEHEKLIKSLKSV